MIISFLKFFTTCRGEFFNICYNENMKPLRILISILIYACLALGITFALYSVDCVRVDNQQKPLFCIVLIGVDDGGTKVYRGFGYQIIVWRRLTSPGMYLYGVERHFLFGIVDPFINGPSIPLINITEDEYR